MLRTTGTGGTACAGIAQYACAVLAMAVPFAHARVMPPLRPPSMPTTFDPMRINVISFGAGEPDFDTPEIVKERAIAEIRKGNTKYTAASGTPELKKAVCAKLKRDQGLDYEPSQIVINCGAKHSLYNIIMCLVEEGDEVIIPAQ